MKYWSKPVLKYRGNVVYCVCSVDSVTSLPLPCFPIFVSIYKKTYAQPYLARSNRTWTIAISRYFCVRAARAKIVQ